MIYWKFNNKFMFDYNIREHIRKLKIKNLDLTIIRPSQCFKTFILRNSQRSSSIKKVVLKNFIIYTKKHICWCRFLIKISILLKKLQHRCFPGSICEIIKNACFDEHLQRLLLHLPHNHIMKTLAMNLLN